jgi:drug/metabolite transporter (DMT)-like permease
MSTWGFAAPIPIGLLLWWLSPMPTSLAPAALWPIAGAIAVTTVGYLAITTAMRMAPVSIVAPFRYTRLIFTPALGILFFGDRPDAMTLFGAGIILVAGLYTFIRERQLSRSVAPPLVHPVASEAQAVQPRR